MTVKELSKKTSLRMCFSYAENWLNVK